MTTDQSSPRSPAEQRTAMEQMRAELDALKGRLARADDALMWMVVQYMEFPDGYVGHEFMSAQEDAIEYLEDIGWLTGGALERYYWTEASGRGGAQTARVSSNGASPEPALQEATRASDAPASLDAMAEIVNGVLADLGTRARLDTGESLREFCNAAAREIIDGLRGREREQEARRLSSLADMVRQFCYTTIHGEYASATTAGNSAINILVHAGLMAHKGERAVFVGEETPSAPIRIAALLGVCPRCGAALNNISPGIAVIAGGVSVCTTCAGPGEEQLRARGI